MSLLKQKKENDRVAAEAAAKAKEEAILRELAIHPVIKAGCGRDVRDAYFHGLVFAAIADDEKVDADERAILTGVAKSMGIEDAEVDEVISLITNMPSPDAKLQLIEECLCAIKDRESIVKLFYAQFAELWMTGEYDLGELKEYAGMFKNSTGVELSSAQLKDIKVVVSNSTELNSALDDLAAWMGNDELKHFALHRYGDVTSRIEQSKTAKRDAAEAARRKAEQETQRAAVENELHKLQSEIVKECDGWGSMHSEWVQVIKKRMSSQHVELLDLKSEAKKVLNEKCCRDMRSLAGIFGAMAMNVSSSRQLSMWGNTFGERKKIGKIAVLIVCKYMAAGHAFGRWGFLDDMFKTANRRSIENELKQVARSEFGVG